jgi:hypothetical protein
MSTEDTAKEIAKELGFSPHPDDLKDKHSPLGRLWLALIRERIARKEAEQQRDEYGQRLGKPRCLDCNAVGMRNCGYFDECGGHFKYELEERAETAERERDEARKRVTELEAKVVTLEAADFGMAVKIVELKRALQQKGNGG